MRGRALYYVYDVGVLNGGVWSNARSNEKKNQIKAKQKKLFAIFYCFDGFSFACWTYFVHISWAQTTCEYCWAFHMQAKFHSLYFFTFFFRLCFTAAFAMLPPMGILFSFFFLNAKVLAWMCMYQPSRWNSFLPSWLAFLLLLRSTKKSFIITKISPFLSPNSVGIFYFMQVWKYEKTVVLKEFCLEYSKH